MKKYNNQPKNINKERKVNKKVILYSIIALGCLALTYFIHWIFIIPAAILMWLNQRELMR